MKKANLEWNQLRRISLVNNKQKLKRTTSEYPLLWKSRSKTISFTLPSRSIQLENLNLRPGNQLTIIEFIVGFHDVLGGTSTFSKNAEGIGKRAISVRGVRVWCLFCGGKGGPSHYARQRPGPGVRIATSIKVAPW